MSHQSVWTNIPQTAEVTAANSTVPRVWTAADIARIAAAKGGGPVFSPSAASPILGGAAFPSAAVVNVWGNSVLSIARTATSTVSVAGTSTFQGVRSTFAAFYNGYHLKLAAKRLSGYFYASTTVIPVVLGGVCLFPLFLTFGQSNPMMGYYIGATYYDVANPSVFFRCDSALGDVNWMLCYRDGPLSTPMAPTVLDTGVPVTAGAEYGMELELTKGQNLKWTIHTLAGPAVTGTLTADPNMPRVGIGPVSPPGPNYMLNDASAGGGMVTHNGLAHTIAFSGFTVATRPA